MRCPFCNKGKYLYPENDLNESGAIKCEACGETVKIIDGIYHFLKDRKNVSGVDYESASWHIEERERERYYERVHGFNDEWLCSLPFPDIEIETTFQKKGAALGENYFNILESLHLSKSEKVLDLAAGTCWTSRHFAKSGCKVVATDIRTIKYHGLRSAEAYFERGEEKFERICWSFGPIPFDDETFDIVFCQNAFQYVDDLHYMINEIRRVLKTNGIFILSWTGVRAPFKDKKYGPGYYLSAYLKNIKACQYSQIKYNIPESLINESRVVATRENNNIVINSAIKLMSKSKFLRTVFYIYGRIPAAHVIGAPINIVATK